MKKKKISRSELIKNWDISYKKKQNFLLYPSEQLVRFFNRYISKRKSIKKSVKKIEALDYGCGAGRHLLYLEENGVKTIGYDISKIAINLAKKLLKYKKIKNIQVTDNLKSKLFENKKFDLIVSYGVLDSMTISDVKMSLDFIYEKLKKNGLFFVEILGHKTLRRKRVKLSKYEDLIKDNHEKNTIQLYHDKNLIKNLYNKFKIIEKIETFEIKKNYKHHEYIIVFCKK